MVAEGMLREFSRSLRDLRGLRTAGSTSDVGSDSAWSYEDIDGSPLEDEDDDEETGPLTAAQAEYRRRRSVLLGKVRKIKREKLRVYNTHRTCMSNTSLACMVGCIVVLWGLPLYTVLGYELVFGARDYLIDKWHWNTHAWCNVTLANGDIDVARCLEQVANASARKAVGGAGADASSGDASLFGNAKTCLSIEGRRFVGHYADFWVGSDRNLPLHMRWPDPNALAAVYVDPADAKNATSIRRLYAETCRNACVESPACGKWTIRLRMDNLGGRCYFFDEVAQTVGRHGAFVGGACEQMHTEWIRCKPHMHGMWRNIAPLSESPELVEWNSSMTPWNSSSRSDIWCGFLPAGYSQWWPYTAQMVIFTVYMNTGTTVKFAWQGVMGTVVALANLHIMTRIYPYGAYKEPCTEEEDGDAQEESPCVDGMKHASPGYSELFVCFDVLLFLLLLLLSGAEENTIKFGASWHFAMMMEYMDPNHKGDVSGYTQLVFSTTILGAILAIIATLVPIPLLNSRRFKDDMATLAKGINCIWDEVIEYMCGATCSAKRFQIETRIDALSGYVATMRAQLADASWEAPLVRRAVRKRMMSQDMLNSLEDVLEVMFSVQRCVLNEDFTGSHTEFCEALYDKMAQLSAETMQITMLCVWAIEDGQIDSGERAFLNVAIEAMNAKQGALLRAYEASVQARSRPSVEDAAAPSSEKPDALADETVVAFALSYSARRLRDAGSSMTNLRTWSRAVRRAYCALLRAIFCPSPPACDKEQWFFIVRTFVPITVCFIGGVFHRHNALFPQYSSKMTSTLSLLVSRRQDKYSTMHDNIQRLLGVTLGHLLPILLLALTSYEVFPCGSKRHVALKMVTLWVYVFMWTYMYYTSPRWSLTSCLVSAFGIPSLLVPCVDVQNLKETYRDQYQEIAQVTLAIVLQVVVDGLIKKKRPGDLACLRLDEVADALRAGFAAFLEQADARSMRASAVEARELLRAAISSAHDFDPNLRLMPVFSTPFKLQLYRAALKNLQKVASDMYMLAVAVEPGQGSSDLDTGEEAEATEDIEPVWKEAAMRQAVGDVANVLEVVMSTLQTVLSHTSETPIEGAESWAYDQAAYLARWESYEANLYRAFGHANAAEAKAQAASAADVGAAASDASSGPSLGLSANLHARTVVAARALSNAMLHLRNVHERCLKENIY